MWKMYWHLSATGVLSSAASTAGQPMSCASVCGVRSRSSRKLACWISARDTRTNFTVSLTASLEWGNKVASWGREPGGVGMQVSFALQRGFRECLLIMPRMNENTKTSPSDSYEAMYVQAIQL